jgi:LysM repeat protein
MAIKIGAFCFLFIFFYSLSAQTSEQSNYIEKHKLLAISEMERTGIPASIKLAQAILESSWGKSDLAKEANNYFGIKCGKDWEGKKIFKEDDDKDSMGNLIPSCFRAFARVEDSFIAHSEFLRDPSKTFRYGHLFSIPTTDYASWARGLKQSGYATNPQYAELLIGIIEKYSLFQFDSPTAWDMIVFNETAHTEIFYNNNLKYIFPKQGESLEELASRLNLDPQKLIEWNENLFFIGQSMNKQIMVYLEPKKSSYSGSTVWHSVKEGETIAQISQIYGVLANKLYSRNKLERGMEPAPGSSIKLKGFKVRNRPSLNSENFYFNSTSAPQNSDPFASPNQSSQDVQFAFPEAIPGNYKSSRKDNF